MCWRHDPSDVHRPHRQLGAVSKAAQAVRTADGWLPLLLQRTWCTHAGVARSQGAAVVARMLPSEATAAGRRTSQQHRRPSPGRSLPTGSDQVVWGHVVSWQCNPHGKIFLASHGLPLATLMRFVGAHLVAAPPPTHTHKRTAQVPCVAPLRVGGLRFGS